jgi:hypothetical protein
VSDATANDMQPRIAVLEHIAKATLAILERLERRLDTDPRRHLMGITLGTDYETPRFDCRAFNPRIACYGLQQ